MVHEKGGSECSTISFPSSTENSDVSDEAMKIMKVCGEGFVFFMYIEIKAACGNPVNIGQMEIGVCMRGQGWRQRFENWPCGEKRVYL